MKSVQPKREELDKFLKICLDKAFDENREISLEATRETISASLSDVIDKYEATGKMQIMINIGYVRTE